MRFHTTTSMATNVTLNTSNALLYADTTFAATNFTLANGNNTFTAIARDGLGRDNTNSLTVSLPATNSYAYDADGNQTSDSLWVNTWNAENRRVVIESCTTSGTGVPVAARAREVWTHLPDGRWIERIVSTNNGTDYVPVLTNRYIWDGNVLLAVLNNVNALELSFMRGLDLSGTMQGAGGVGGLLAVFSPSAINSQPSTHFVANDGNGNVTMLVNAANGTESARYEYGPFAEPLRMTGPMAKINPIRFSTQYADDVTGDIKYLFRDYTAGTGRWPNRDPIGERGGMNLYGFVGGNPISRVDRLGHDYILQCGIMKPSDFNPPGPTTPSRSDHYNPNGFFGTARPGGVLDQTAWFESHYSGWTSEMKRRINERMEKEMKSACQGGKKPGQIPMSDINTEIVPTMSGNPPPFPFRASTSNPRTPEAGGNEEDYGDRPQSAVWADQVLGRFVYEVNSANVTWADTPSGKCYHWSVALVVTDGMGLNDPDDGLRRALGETGSAHFFPARREVRASWSISGCGCCPCPPAK